MLAPAPTQASAPVPVAATILAAGLGRRLGGRPKAALQIGDRSLLERLVNALRAAGIAVVILAHEEIVRFDDPTGDPYARYQPRLQKAASAILRESANIVGFINYRRTIKEKDVGFNKKVAHAEGGGERLIYLEERPGFLAKNRYSMPASILST